MQLHRAGSLALSQASAGQREPGRSRGWRQVARQANVEAGQRTAVCRERGYDDPRRGMGEQVRGDFNGSGSRLGKARRGGAGLFREARHAVDVRDAAAQRQALQATAALDGNTGAGAFWSTHGLTFLRVFRKQKSYSGEGVLWYEPQILPPPPAPFRALHPLHVTS